MPSFKVSSYTDASGQHGAKADLVAAMVAAAGTRIASYLVASSVVVDVSVETGTGASLASGGAAPVSVPQGTTLITFPAITKLATGQDSNGTAAEIRLTLNPTFFNTDRIYYGTDGVVPANMVEGVAVLMHEMTHGLAFGGFIPSAPNFKSAYDLHVKEVAGKLYFHGPAASALSGGPVPLAEGKQGSAIYHVDSTASSAFFQDLMAPVAVNGKSYTYTDLDLAFLRDVGLPVAKTLVSADGKTVVPGAGAQSLTGTAGVDTAVFTGARSGYTLAGSGAAWQVTAADGTSTLAGIERLQFADARLALDVQGNAGMAYRLYQAAFSRTPDQGGLGFQMKALDDGWNIAQVAANFIASPEFSATYGSLNDAQFVTQLYQNVLHRVPDAVGLAFHTTNLADGANTRANVLVGFSESPENQAALIGTIQGGMLYA